MSSYTTTGTIAAATFDGYQPNPPQPVDVSASPITALIRIDIADTVAYITPTQARALVGALAQARRIATRYRTNPPLPIPPDIR